MIVAHHFDETRGARIRSRFRSIDAHDEQNRIKLTRDGHSKKVQKPYNSVDFDGEVRTHEEAQVFVHDLNQFVTVQPLEETPAVLSLGKLCEDHGYSYECVSGQKPRLTKNGKSIICKTDNFVPLVVPGLSANSGGSSFSTTQSQVSLREDVHLVCGNRPASISSSGSVSERSDELANRRLGQESLKIQTQNKKRDDTKNSDDPLADIPDWLAGFGGNLVEELHAPAHSSPKIDLEHPVEVATKSKTHSIYCHFPKDRKCDVCLRTKITSAPCRRRTGEALPRAEKFGDLITADHKFLSEGCEDLATQWIQSYPCKTKSLHETVKKVYQGSWSRPTHPKLYTQTTRWNLGKHVKIYHGITALQHLIDPRRMALLIEAFDE